MSVMKSAMIGEIDILLLGLGQTGCRAACYVHQRGGLPGVRLIAADLSEQMRELQAGFPTLILRPPDADGLCRDLQELLETQTASARAGLILAALGELDETLLQAVALAAAAQLPMAVYLAVLSTEPLTPAELELLRQLRQLHPAVQLLSCPDFAGLFADQSAEERQPQADRWLAENAMIFLRPFARPLSRPERSAASGNGQLDLMFASQPRGIFTGRPGGAAVDDENNLDIPTYLRLHLDIDDGR